MRRTGSGSAPPYLRIVKEIERRIDSGALRPGDRVPSIRQAAARWGVATATAAKALDTLRRQGRVVAVPRVGTVVAEPAPASTPRSGAGAVTGRARRERRAAATGRNDERERVVRAAIVLADAQGFEAVSMRGIAVTLGMPTMSLYGLVRGKEELAALMADTVFGELELPRTPPAGWRAHLELAARLQWRLYLRHPWLPRLMSLTHPQPLPNLLRFGNWGMSPILGLGLDPETARIVWWAVANHVRGTATNLEAQRDAEQHTGLSPDQWYTAHLPSLHAALSTPTAPIDDRLGFDLTAFFEAGLRLLLDGAAVQIGRQHRT
ncbi:GntR family transcriptional regulator [Planobispora rosea]|uniref:GntR family transcriptional regulator n=1 Tax=Planobispora rosea TaxID=35762 RepID=A0A8J3SA89_PLARO|nr:GntR family transcriptional regulator [Planobispora rosea]GGT04910.1 GntR family transcriptional regulator [Planobispora rosea]GIH88915.1 GntR family transcriptional regulator [Planobispora rosea]